MATEALQTNSSAWPQVGNPPPNAMSPTDPNPEWEMVADDTITSNANGTDEKDSTDNKEHVVILPANIDSSIQSNKIKGRPRSATIGGEHISQTKTPHQQHPTMNTSDSTTGVDTSINSDVSSRTKRRTLRRCVSTPDLLVSDNAHEVIVEDESDESTACSEEDLKDEQEDLGESFEVVSDQDEEEEEEAVEEEDVPEQDYDSGEGNDESLFMIDDDDDEEEESGFQRCDEESATLVSTPSMDTSTAWTMASATPSNTTVTGSMWGMKKSPSFAEMLSKNINDDNSNNNGAVGWGCDKTKTEAMLRDSHRKHHLRVKTKPKFIVTDDAGGMGGKTMKHAHSTGDLSQMLVGAEQERARMFGQGRKRMTKKQFSDIMEEDDEGDFVIGKGSGGGSAGGGGDGDVMGETDAMDFYHRKDKGSKGTTNKKKLRPDEAKRKDIIMHKKELQRKKQAESQKNAAATEKSTPGKKKKNEKGVGGKKERRRL